MIEIAAQTWAERAQAEIGAAERFRMLADQLKRAQSHVSIYERVRAAEEEEERHAQLCAEMAKKLGHPTGFSLMSQRQSSPHVYSWRGAVNERDQALLDTVLICCITESFNACLLNSIYEQMHEGEAKTLIHQILKDEVKHAQIGWGHLQYESELRDCRFITDYLTEMFDHSVRDQLFESHERPSNLDLFSFGVMPKPMRLQQFQDTLEYVIYPGFERMEIDITPIKQWFEKHTTCN
jgi:hypothetical protein